jgi:hypothetical protein
VRVEPFDAIERALEALWVISSPSQRSSGALTACSDVRRAALRPKERPLDLDMGVRIPYS